MFSVQICFGFVMWEIVSGEKWKAIIFPFIVSQKKKKIIFRFITHNW